MKNFTFLLSFLAVAAITYSGCNKNDNNNPSGNAGSMSLKYDGTSWAATGTVQASDVNDIINVTGIDANNHQATVTLEGISQTGTYLVGPGNPNNQLSWTEGTNPEDVYQANWTIGLGTVIITQFSSDKIEGTFQFTGYNINQDSTVITDGSFSANLQ